MNQEDIIKGLEKDFWENIASRKDDKPDEDDPYNYTILSFIRAKIQEAYNAGGKRMGEIMKEEMEIEIPKIKQEARSQLIKEIEEKLDKWIEDEREIGNNAVQFNVLQRLLLTLLKT